MAQIWLNDLANIGHVAYLFDTTSGSFRRFRTREMMTLHTAGSCEKMGRRLVAHYVSGDGLANIIQVGRFVYPLDGTTTAQARVHLGGLYSTLELARPDMPTQRMVLPTPLRHLSLDPDYYTDGAESLASHVLDPQAQRYFRDAHDFKAGPWHLLERTND